MGRSRSCPAAAGAAAAVAAAATAVLIALALVPAAAAGAPPLPTQDRFLVGLSLSATTPGGTSDLVWSLADPLSTALGQGNLTFAFYAVNGYPGNATGPPPANAPAFEEAGGSLSETLSTAIPYLAPGARVGGYAEVWTSPATPVGTYAVRTQLSFVSHGTAYLLRSRGWFSLAQWDSATSTANGTATLNLTRLGVSGVLPETALLVQPPPLSVPLALLLGTAVVLLGAGAFAYYRRSGLGARSGARGPPSPSQPRRARGSREKRDGD